MALPAPAATSSSWVMIGIQIILAIVVIIILYILTLVVLNIDSLVVTRNVKVSPMEKTVIIDGFAPVSQLARRDFNTINPFVPNFRKIAKSLNTQGGAQYTYQFWMKIEKAQDALFDNLIIFLKGDNRLYKLGLYDKASGKRVRSFSSDYLINCPMVRFGSSYRDLRVSFNTANGPMPVRGSLLEENAVIKMNPEGTDTTRMNLLSLLPMNWFLLTFVFKDNYSSTAAENGIDFRFYVNEQEYYSKNASTDSFLQNNTLKQNEGNLYLFPNLDSAGDFMKIGNMIYYNYALTPHQVKGVYNQGPPTHAMREDESVRESKAFITAYNKMDVYNR